MSKRVDDLQPGDEVVIDIASSVKPYKISKVQRVTQTRIIDIDGNAYSKQSKKRVGDSSTSYCWRLATSHRSFDLMTVEEAQRINDDATMEMELSRLARQIKDTPKSKLEGLGIDLLRQIVELLEQAE